MNATELTREHLEDLLKSETFRRSAKLSRLLRRLVEPTLSGGSHPIKEQILGIEVFERPADWDPQTDSIVRVHVNRLRHTLKSYYADQTPPPLVKFEIPKGSYVARCVMTSVDQFPPSQQQGTGTIGLERGQPSTLGRTAESKHSVRPLNLRLQGLTYERGDLTNAAFCPDEESVVYSACWHGESATLYSQRIGQKHSRPLGLPPGKLCDVSTTGQLLFTLGEGDGGARAGGVERRAMPGNRRRCL